ncbi:hypothetical protein HQQ94_18415 [Shewanella sp. VB17]|uniref:DUF5908 family protein n=1 Tax=Shewanella sp. VB17 TaxID=2739432 RepID=UPI001564B6D0|nr:DUF5908 family protein [Shewanella sp. VB17]NRD75157.1 hypothetical protein [Shewanella sp. VB17]
MAIEVKQLVIKSNVINGQDSPAVSVVTEEELDAQQEEVLKRCFKMIQQQRVQTRER